MFLQFIQCTDRNHELYFGPFLDPFLYIAHTLSSKTTHTQREREGERGRQWHQEPAEGDHR